jgi:hypothetical protein
MYPQIKMIKEEKKWSKTKQMEVGHKNGLCQILKI